MTTIVLARHGETDWNRELRWQGQSDVPLNDTGRGQAHALAERLIRLPIKAVYSSDLKRAQDTAEVFACRVGLDVLTLRELREIDVGSWEGLTREEIFARDPGAFEQWEHTDRPGWEGGETHEEMAERFLGGVRRIAASHDGETVLVVAHGAAIRAVRTLARGLRYPAESDQVPRMDNGEVIVIRVEDGKLAAPDVALGTEEPLD